MKIAKSNRYRHLTARDVKATPRPTRSAKSFLWFRQWLEAHGVRDLEMAYGIYLKVRRARAFSYSAGRWAIKAPFHPMVYALLSEAGLEVKPSVAPILPEPAPSPPPPKRPAKPR